MKSRTCIALSLLAILSLVWGCTSSVQMPPVPLFLMSGESIIYPEARGEMEIFDEQTNSSIR